MRIRLATPADAPELARLRYEFRAGIDEPAEPAEGFVTRTAAWMADRLAVGSVWRCWLAEQDGQVAGHLWLQLIEKVPNPGAEREVHGYITNVYVDPNFRGAGTGTLLMETALAFCREGHVDSVILWPTDRSRSLYGRFGFENPADMMELVLDHGRQPH